ncbi:DUF2975 domain-containing protein [Sphingomonas sp. NSE70-1]|uniref:DUF2975 domain-containing protein n=1 Tax=Sphingomonas caseinilyticus TaxID=2908205 RepID=A0ABT0RWG4_9SPHN|nr:DUF2975 domain-containing protein [Sphingomonas caseinilyticus]MCL6699173.1 DUF2975 domain-containing protein [Sphingomonas caseinilyticus]
MRHSTALPLAYVFLRILVLLNWIFGACILALLAFTFINESWTMKALGVSGMSDAVQVMWAMRGIAALGIATVPINYQIFKRLLKMVDTVRAGDPFVADNAYRLHAIAWLLVALQLISMTIAGIGRIISTEEHPFHLDAGFSANSWLAIILCFVLARVFAEGTLMREDLEGTV